MLGERGHESVDSGSGGKAVPQHLEKIWVLPHGRAVIIKRQLTIPVVVHLLHEGLDQVFDDLFRVLVRGVSLDASLQVQEHVLSLDIAVTHHVVDSETELDALIEVTSEEDGHADDPGVHGDDKFAVAVERGEDAVDEDVVREVQKVEHDSTEVLSVHGLVLGQLAKNYQEGFQFLVAKLC